MRRYGGRRRIGIWLGLVSFAALAGCGSKTYPVQGRVVFADGAPATELAGYLVMFQSEAQKASADGVIQPDGSFTVGTLQPGDGALPGKQRVAITPPTRDLHKPPPPLLLPTRYARFETSQLEVDIQPGTNQVTLTLERRKK